MPGDGKSPGFSTARCFSTARTRAIPGIGRSSRSGVRLIELARWHRVALVASGHLHKAHDFRNEGTRYIWAPASSFLVGEMAPPMPGEKRLGAVVYDIEDGTLKAEITEVPGLAPHWIDDVVEEVYPRPPDR